jgi:hypothetical protein
LYLEPGDTVESDGFGRQTAPPQVSATGMLAKQHGVWVFRTGQPLPASATDEMLRQIREECDQANLSEGA